MAGPQREHGIDLRVCGLQSCSAHPGPLEQAGLPVAKANATAKESEIEAIEAGACRIPLASGSPCNLDLSSNVRALAAWRWLGHAEGMTCWTSTFALASLF